MSDENREQINRRVRECFFLPHPQDRFFAEINRTIAACSSELQDVGRSFVHNLDAVMSTLGLPAILAIASVEEKFFSQYVLLAEVFQVLKKGDTAEEFPSPENIEAGRRFIAEHSPEMWARKSRHALNFLNHASQRKEVVDALQELLHQGTALIWGTFETLVRDVFVSILNARPVASRLLLTDPNTRKLFPLKDLDLDLLEKYDYNLSNSMGQVLAAMHDFSNLGKTKDLLGAMFPVAAELRRLLGAREVWLLCQRRHLIVHKRGIVDERYVAESGEVLVVGTRLILRPVDVFKSLTLVRDIGGAVVQEASQFLAAG